MSSNRILNAGRIHVSQVFVRHKFAILASAILIQWGWGCKHSADGNPPMGELAATPNAPAVAADTAVEQVQRDIEEADVVKVVGDKVYVLNRFKGLLVIDVSNTDAPALIGQLDLHGRGVEMYVVGSQVFAILSADYYVPYLGGPGVAVEPATPVPPPPEFDGSRLAIIDVSNPASPQLQGKINLVGYANSSRRVGNVIYVVGENFTPYGGPVPVTDNANLEGFVASVNVADPAIIVPVERKTFSGQSLAIHVSQTTIFAAGQVYDSDNGETSTHVQAIDISDPAGTIVLRGTFDVPGFIRDRFCMDDFEGVFRIATESNGFGFQKIRVFAYDRRASMRSHPWEAWTSCRANRWRRRDSTGRKAIS
jgi:hypothetical protein